MAPQVAYVLQDCRMRVLVTSRTRWARMARRSRDRPTSCMSCSSTTTGPRRPRVALHDLHVLQAEAVSRQHPALHRSRHGREPLHLGQHRHAQGRGAVPPQPDRRRGERRALPREPADDLILAVLPLSFDAGLSQLTTASRRRPCGARSNYLLARDVVRLSRGTASPGSARAAAVDPARRAAAGRRGTAACATSPTPAGACRGDPRRCARLPAPQPYLMYGLTEAFRSTYLDPAEVDRRPDSIGKAIPNAEILVVRRTARRASRASRASWSTAAPWSRSATGTIRRARPSGSGPRPAAHGSVTPELAVWSGDTVAPTRRLPVLRRPARRHDQDLRLPGQPDRDRGGGLRQRAGPRRGRARTDDEALGHRVVLV